MLIDEVRIKAIAGKGGDGVVAFDKIKMSLGPTGGRGGNGGSVYFQGISDVFALRKYRHKKEYLASNGKNGRGNRSDGPMGKDLFLTVPIGTIIRNIKNGKIFEITQSGEKFLVAKGGLGGRGNFFFRSSKNTSPQEFEKGKMGEEFDFELELRLIADAGLIGLPSVGKSSLLNELTATDVKVGEYHFTTLEPNLGAMKDIIIADIPGLIEGASSGKGLGIKFLRHIQRTKILLHCLSFESENMLEDYRIIRKELEKYNPELLLKKEIIVLTKSDLAKKEILFEKVKYIEKQTGKKVLAVSIHDLDAIQNLAKEIEITIK